MVRIRSLRLPRGLTVRPMPLIARAARYGKRRMERLARACARALRVRLGRLHWAIRISAPSDPSASRWGDTAFAQDLAEALRARGQRVRIVYFGTGEDDRSPADDVSLTLRGLHRLDPSHAAVNYLWIISHPDAVNADECAAGWTRMFVASLTWTPPGGHAEPLLQAASLRRFPSTASVTSPTYAYDTLFVGTSRGIARPVIHDAVTVGADLAIFGHDWERFVDSRFVRADHLPFAQVADAYARARVVLNDHWADMREKGFISNRLFDAAFVGARVISDDVAGLDEIFGGLVQTYDSLERLRLLLSSDDPWPSRQETWNIAATVRARHSFDARAATLIERALSDLRRAP